MLVWWFALCACKGGGDADTDVDCAACDEAGELCVAHLDEAAALAPFTICAPVPSECGATLDCSDNTCVLDAFGLCEAGYEGGLCREDMGPALTCYAEAP